MQHKRRYERFIRIGLEKLDEQNEEFNKCLGGLLELNKDYD